MNHKFLPIVNVPPRLDFFMKNSTCVLYGLIDASPLASLRVFCDLL